MRGNAKDTENRSEGRLIKIYNCAIEQKQATTCPDI